MLNQEVIFNIFKLMDTMELGISCIEERLEILDIESTKRVLTDIINVFAVEEERTSMIEELEENEIIEKLKRII